MTGVPADSAMAQLARAMGLMLEGLEHWSSAADDAVILGSSSLDRSKEYKITAGLIRAAAKEADGNRKYRNQFLIGEPEPMRASLSPARAAVSYAARYSSAYLLRAGVDLPILTTGVQESSEPPGALWRGRCAVHGVKWTALSGQDGSLPAAGPDRPMLCPECMNATKPVARLLAWYRPDGGPDAQPET